MCIGLHVKYALFLSDFKKLEFSPHIIRNTKIPNLMKICPVVAELLQADRWTDRQANMMRLIVTFCNFANTPKYAENCTASYHVKLSE